MRLIKDNRPVFALKQVLTFFGFMDDKAGGDNGDAERAPGDILRAARFDDVAFRIKPFFSG